MASRCVSYKLKWISQGLNPYKPQPECITSLQNLVIKTSSAPRSQKYSQLSNILKQILFWDTLQIYLSYGASISPVLCFLSSICPIFLWYCAKSSKSKCKKHMEFSQRKSGNLPGHQGERIFKIDPLDYKNLNRSCLSFEIRLLWYILT